ncbi:DJ-1/PfpI family protein [Escherichia coli]|uniref:DJ-1/PfpI family protein n=1 Tax=Escherichia coli TaxID=562 RepID=A0AAP6AYH4_ECOLX|nr:DJ-1/PfpI family protein [Escherichia coli]EED1845377.1 DJ-1/PfpI family protein [Escherichia coli]EEZ1594903.1 DJ-1/PfpI family protein [Escherichia coli]EIT9645234.1 DJ-1/PfpI family protein [Escherichia coli]ELP0840212.1 DJ-1/PfpI family protein [Escherichia coli]MCX8308327.1 DJ-1/PfpI family protein [Escherichia coli]
MKKILLIAGDFSEDYEVMVPWQVLNMLGFRVDVVCPGKRTDEFIKTAIHDFEGDQTYTEKPGHLFRLTASFDEIRLQEYGGIYISGGRSSEYLRLNKTVLNIVHHAMNLTLPVAAICHGTQILAAAGVLRGRKLTGYFTVKPEVEMAGGMWVTVANDDAVVDGNLITAATWMGHPAILRHFIALMGIRIVR